MGKGSGRDESDEGRGGVLRLRDGRRVAYAEYGVRTGRAILYCHGGLSSGHDIAVAHASARSMGIRIVSPDRPGIGGSDRDPDPSLLAAADDALALADHLELDDFGVLGWSLGGQHALALAHRAPRRVGRATLVAGCPPLDGDALADLNTMDRALVALAQRTPWAMRTLARAARQLTTRFPEACGRVLGATGQPDLASLSAARRRALVADLRRALRDPAGLVDEYRVLVAPWGFAPADVSTPTWVVQGGRDAYVSVDWARALVSALPHGQLTVLPGEGHFLGAHHWPELLDWTAGAQCANTARGSGSPP